MPAVLKEEEETEELKHGRGGYTNPGRQVEAGLERWQGSREK
jgi:hypothetical protein